MSVRQPPKLTPGQYRVYLLVSHGIGSVTELLDTLARQGVVTGRRALQRMLQRMCEKGFVTAMCFPRASGRRGHFHIGTLRGAAACEAYQKALAAKPATERTPQPTELLYWPQPLWVAETLRRLGDPQPIPREELDRLIDKHLPHLKLYARMAALRSQQR